MQADERQVVQSRTRISKLRKEIIKQTNEHRRLDDEVVQMKQGHDELKKQLSAMLKKKVSTSVALLTT